MKKSLLDSVAELKAKDIYSMSLQTYAASICELVRRTRAFEAVLRECSINPERLKKSGRREQFLKFAKLELEAGELLFELFASDGRFDRVCEDIKKIAQAEESNTGSWEDFMRFWELEDEKLEFIRAFQLRVD